MKRIKSGLSYRVAVLFLGYVLAGCAAPVQHSSANEERISMQQTIRVIIYFNRSAGDSQQLTSALAEACHCRPVFVRQYRDDALIYEIALPRNDTYATFENALMKNAASLGIKLMEQDRPMQHQ